MNNLSPVRPEFSDVIRSIFDTMMLDHYVAMPAKVVKYDSATQYADVQPQLYQKFNDGSLQAYPVIPGVPVKHPRAQGGKSFIHLPLEAGDDVILIFSSRSLDNWKSSGGMTDPDDSRKNHLTDAFALAGGSAKPDAFKVQDPTAIEITNDQATIQVLPSGKFKIKNQANELLDVLDQISQQVHTLAETLSTDTVNTIFGPMQLNAFSTYENIATQLSDLVSKLETLKG